MNDILVVDDDPMMLHAVSGLLKSQSNFLNVFPVVGIQKAIKILSNKAFRLLVTGIRLAEADAFNLALLMSGNSNTPIIVMTHNASSDFKEKIKTIDSVVHFDHARDISLLPRQILADLGIEFGGQLQASNLVAFLQMMEMEEQSGTFMVTAKGRCGTIATINGKPLNATTGSMTGEAAALEILTWENISIDIDYSPPRGTCEIHTTLMNLLLQSGKTADDKRFKIRALRTHQRHECRKLAEFCVGRWKFHCCLHDISEGGAYMETDQPLKVGHRLKLSLYSPSLGRSGHIAGTVVRRDAKGVGIRFESLTENQRLLVYTLVENNDCLGYGSGGTIS